MPHTLFIADLHLCKEEPAITAGFLAFLQREACQAEALYILGDLFEAWIGDDLAQPLHTQIATALSALTQAGIPCYFIHGNRDFLLGKNYAAACGMTLLPEEKVLALYGKRILIMHGDTLCTDDQAYQRFRRKVHQRWLQKLFLTLPFFIRTRIATRMRADSKQANRGKDSAIMDVNQDAVIRTMTHHDVHYLIHGHTHRPAIHQLTVNGQPAQRLVSGAWHHEGWLIRVSESETTLISFPFEK